MDIELIDRLNRLDRILHISFVIEGEDDEGFLNEYFHHIPRIGEEVVFWFQNKENKKISGKPFLVKNVRYIFDEGYTNKISYGVEVILKKL